MSVLTEVCGRVFIVRITRESKRNAIDDGIAAELDSALAAFELDPELWVGILTGTSTVFSAGTDLRNAGTPRTVDGGEYGVIRRARTKPLIAAVEGYAMGGGFEIALACDLIVASRDATFGLPEARRGLVASAGALLRLADRLPPNLATEMLVAGANLPAVRAHDLGLVNRLSAPGRALDAAIDLAHDICLSSPLSVAHSLAVLRAIRAESEARGWEHSDMAAQAVRQSDDAREGVAAFLGKREPRWEGR